MTKFPVLNYSTYGHAITLASTIAERARTVGRVSTHTSNTTCPSSTSRCS
ncbi:MAG: hypothetical protein ACOYM3_04920 [Terrimicrobiaceae bacterium]